MSEELRDQGEGDGLAEAVLDGLETMSHAPWMFWVSLLFLALLSVLLPHGSSENSLLVSEFDGQFVDRLVVARRCRSWQVH